MNNLNIKAENRILLNKKITSFYNDLIENLNYIICNKIKPINEKQFLNFKEVDDFVNKCYLNSKHRKLFDAEIEKTRDNLGDLNSPITTNQSFSIDRTFSDLINNYSDSFQTDFNKKIVEITKKDSNQLNNFKQALYNSLIHKIEKDFNLKGLPDNYKLSINYFQLSSLKQG